MTPTEKFLSFFANEGLYIAAHIIKHLSIRDLVVLMQVHEAFWKNTDICHLLRQNARRFSVKDWVYFMQVYQEFNHCVMENAEIESVTSFALSRIFQDFSNIRWTFVKKAYNECTIRIFDGKINFI